MPVLIPLTVDRMLAVVKPLHYSRWMSANVSKMMVAASWLCLLVVLIADIALLSSGGKVGNLVVHTCVDIIKCNHFYFIDV